MNTNPLEQFKTDLKQVRLSEHERTEMHSTLQLFVKTNPVHAPVRSRGWMRAHVLHRAVFAYALGALLIVTLPTVYASGQSLPGDTLYALKVNVLEPTTEFLSFNNEARAERTTEHTQQRLREIASVRTDERHAEKISVASNELEEGVNRVRKHLRESEDISLQKKIEIQKDLLSVVEAHETILDTVSSSTKNNELAETQVVLENELIETIGSFVETADTDTVLDHIEDSIEKIQERVKSVAYEEERTILEQGVSETIAELAEGNTDEALQTLILSEQDAEAFDVVQNLTAEDTQDTPAPEEKATQEMLGEPGTTTEATTE
ncbi:MAG: hypothetical protein AMXMBFR44_1530 [Candidatus Campbellbacteria bacterium]